VTTAVLQRPQNMEGNVNRHHTANIADVMRSAQYLVVLLGPSMRWHSSAPTRSVNDCYTKGMPSVHTARYTVDQPVLMWCPVRRCGSLIVVVEPRLSVGYTIVFIWRQGGVRC